MIQKKWVKSVDGLLQICFKIGYVTLIIKLLYKISKIEQYEKIIHVQMIQKIIFLLIYAAQTNTHTHSSPFIPVFTEILNLLHYLFLGEKVCINYNDLLNY